MANQSVSVIPCRGSTIRFAVCSTLAAFLIASTAAAQSSNQVVIKNDDGGPAQIMHFSMPDFMDLRQPDFVKRDVPTFVERLVLSDDQTSVVQKMIDDYLESFKKLMESHLPKGAAPLKLALGGGVDEKGPGFKVAGAGDDPDELPDLDGVIDTLPDMAGLDGDMPGKMAVGVSVRVGGPEGEDDGAADVEPGVAISFETPDGEPIPEEVRKKLEEAASKIAAEVKARMEKQAAEGGDGADFMPLGGPVSIEEIQKRNQELADKAEAFRKAKADLRQTFVNDVQTKLAESQIERWPDLERTLRREKTLPKGRLSGERTDLVKVLKGLKLSEAEHRAAAEPVEGYESTLDAALRQRNEFVPVAESKINKAMQDGDIDKALSIIDRAAQLRVAVRSINEQFTDAVAQALPVAAAQTFRDAVQRASYPSIYRSTFAQKTFDAAKKIDGIDEKTLASVRELEKAYLSERNSVNDQIRQALSKYEPLEPRRGIEKLKAIKEGQPASDMMMGETSSEDPIREAFGKRRELDDRYSKLVHDMLPPEQAENLPKQPERHKGGEPLIIRKMVPPVDGPK